MVSSTQIATVKSQYDAAGGDYVITVFFKKMLAAHPEHRALFKKFSYPVNESDAGFKESVKLTSDSTARALELGAAGKETEMREYLHGIAERHKKHKVGQTQFQTGKSFIAATAQEVVGAGADVGAWEAVLGLILDCLQ